MVGAIESSAFIEDVEPRVDTNPLSIPMSSCLSSCLHEQCGAFIAVERHRTLLGDSLNRRGIAVFRYISFDLIADCHAVHLGLLVDADPSRFAAAVLDRYILCPDIVDPAADRILLDPFSHRR